MVGGDFQNSLQLFVAYGYCMFKGDVCFDPSCVLVGMPNYANITFLELFVKPCIDWPKVMNEGPNYAIVLISEFCAGARCPPALAPSGVAATEVQS